MTEISVLIPCLNEEEAIRKSILDAQNACEKLNIPFEIIVIDNNSTDNSSKIAKKAGAKVILEKTRGYGKAYLKGINKAKGKYIFMSDADGTYDFNNIITSYNLCENEGFDFVIGDRYANMDKKSMPWAHKYIGNPLFTTLINIISKTKINDSNSGMRMIKTSKLRSLELKKPGMEFASEMIIEAARHKLKTKEIPITYSKRIGPSKLRTIRDGSRILFMLINYLIFNPVKNET